MKVNYFMHLNTKYEKNKKYNYMDILSAYGI